MGGVLVFPDQTGPRFFGSDVARPLVDKWFAAMKHIIGPVETYTPWWWPDPFGINIWLGNAASFSATTTIMVQWMLSSKALRAMLTSESFYFALRSLSAMGLIGPGSRVFPRRAIVLTTRLELGMYLASL